MLIAVVSQLQVCKAVKHAHCVFIYDDKSGTVTNTSGVTWKVPAGVGVTADTSEASGQIFGNIPS